MTKRLTVIFIALTACLIFVSEAAAQSRRTRAMACPSPNGRSMTEAYLPESVDVPPEFPGGDLALMRFINAERRYPAEAYSAGIQGRVICAFIVTPEGHISNVEVVKGVDESLNREAVRLIRSMPRWSAGRLGREHVSVFCILPIPFRL